MISWKTKLRKSGKMYILTCPKQIVTAGMAKPGAEYRVILKNPYDES